MDIELDPDDENVPDPISRAYDFFSSEDELCEVFDIEIVDGEFPGSSYYAAELQIPIEQVNLIARINGLAYRFRAGSW